MTEIHWLAMQAISIVKVFVDRGCGDVILEQCGNDTIDEDAFFEISSDALSQIFSYTKHDYNDDGQFDVWVFSDPILDEFVKLSTIYENRRHITEDENPFRKDMVSIIHRSFSWNQYTYDYTWYLRNYERGRNRIVLFCSYEFNVDYDVFEGLFDVYDGFHKTVDLLKAELKKTMGDVVPFPQETEILEVAA